MKKLIAATAFAVALGASALVPASAQMGGGGGPMMGMMGGGCHMMGMMGRGMRGGGMLGNPARMDAMVAGRLAYLKAELGITDAQSQAWSGYVDAVNSRVETMKGMRQSMMAAMQSGNAVDRMEARTNAMEAMVEAMKAVNPAIKALYEVLTDDQKEIADQLIGMDCGAM